MAYVELDMKDIRDFFDKISGGADSFRDSFETFLDGIGNEFLRIIEDEIIRRKVMDTRQLLASFRRGDSDNVWETSDGGFTLEVGSAVNYASFVNDGHWANPQGVEKRFVPGKWDGDRFIYDPRAKGGMMLKQQWVEGAHYFDSAFRILEDMFPELMEKKLDEWINEYLAG